MLRRSLFALVLVFGLIAGSLASAFAGGSTIHSGLNAAQQDDGTPEADDDSASSRDSDGKTVEVVDESGDPSLKITISNVNLDWQDYEDYSAPDRGIHYVAFELSVENVGSRHVDFSDFDIFVRDDQGFIYGDSYVSVLEDSPSDKIGEFDSSDGIEDGDTVSGLLVFAVPDAGNLVDAFYAPSGRLITIATFESED